MLEVIQMCLYAAGVFIVLAFVCDLVVVTMRHKEVARHEEVLAARESAKEPALAAAARGSTSASVVLDEGPLPAGNAPAVEFAPASSRARGLAWYGTAFAILATLLLTASLVMRTMVTGHGPFTNQHEFAVSFTWGIMAAYVFFLLRFQVRALSLVLLPTAAGMLLYGLAMDNTVEPLIPALQNNLLLTIHVATAVLAYGAAAVAFGAAVLYLIRPKLRTRLLPSRELLDEIGYRAGVLTFPLLTIMILLGAVWAEIAWGRYWSWDPKETAALVTWLIYGAYLHARVVRDWRGNRAAWLLIIGFAAVLFTYFGNHFLGGLHSYA